MTCDVINDVKYKHYNHTTRDEIEAVETINNFQLLYGIYTVITCVYITLGIFNMFATIVCICLNIYFYPDDDEQTIINMQYASK